MNEFTEPAQSVLGWKLEFLIMAIVVLLQVLCYYAWEKWK